MTYYIKINNYLDITKELDILINKVNPTISRAINVNKATRYLVASSSSVYVFGRHDTPSSIFDASIIELKQPKVIKYNNTHHLTHLASPTINKLLLRRTLSLLMLIYVLIPILAH